MNTTPEAVDPNQMLSAKQVAQFLSLNPVTVMRMAQRGELRAHRFNSRLVRFKYSDVMTFLQSKMAAQ